MTTITLSKYLDTYFYWFLRVIPIFELLISSFLLFETDFNNKRSTLNDSDFLVFSEVWSSMDFLRDKSIISGLFTTNCMITNLDHKHIHAIVAITYMWELQTKTEVSFSITLKSGMCFYLVDVTRLQCTMCTYFISKIVWGASIYIWVSSW